MSRLTLCCLQPLLNPELDSEYYDALGLERRCSAAAIKKSYRNLSLRLHPDKRAQRGETVTEEDVATFQRVKEAYETLSDPKKRRLYDAVGELGLKMNENPASVSPEAVFAKMSRISTRCRCIILVSVMVWVGFFFAYFPLLAALNLDGVTDIDWAIVMLPVWVVDAFMLLNVFTWVFCESTTHAGGAPPPSEEEFVEGDDEEVMAGDAPMWVRYLILAKTCLLVAFQALAVAALDGADISPWIVFLPLFLREVLALCELAPIALCTSSVPPDPPSEDEEDDHARVEAEIKMMEYIQRMEERNAYRRAAVYTGFRLLFEFLIALKLSLPGGGKSSSMSWWVVFIPVWLQAGIYLARGCMYAKEATLISSTISSPNTDEENPSPEQEEDKFKTEAAMQASMAASSAYCSAFCLSAVGILVVIRLLHQRDPYIPAIVVFSPILFAVCCCYCCTGIVICCFRSVDEEDFQPEVGGGESGESDAANTDHDTESDGTYLDRTADAPPIVIPPVQTASADRIRVDSPLVAAAVNDNTTTATSSSSSQPATQDQNIILHVGEEDHGISDLD